MGIKTNSDKFFTVEQSRSVANPGLKLLRSLRKANLLGWLFLLIGGVMMIFPFLWMISTSFKPAPETVAFPPTLLPQQWTLTNYVDAFNRIDIPRLYLNTTFITIVRLIITLYTSLLLGYVFAKFQFWGRNVLFFIILATMIIPFEVYMIPLYVMMVDFKLGKYIHGPGFTHPIQCLLHLYGSPIYVFDPVRTGRCGADRWGR